jgi:hypothetical protein
LLVGGGDVGGFSSYLNFFSWNEEKFAPLLFIFCFSLSSTVRWLTNKEPLEQWSA